MKNKTIEVCRIIRKRVALQFCFLPESGRAALVLEMVLGAATMAVVDNQYDIADELISVATLTQRQHMKAIDAVATLSKTNEIEL